MRQQLHVVIFFSFLALAGAQRRCDPITQYEMNGTCCQLCPPGTSMSSLSSCQEFHCRLCESGDYQDKYTKEAKCHRQQSCDPNKNFQEPKHDTKKRTTCVCKEGFHCSSEACITCVPHTACRPGYGVQSEGSHSKDTVCEECSEGTFTQNKSHTEACRKWTECLSGQTLLQPGTATSDSVCGGQRWTHVVGISLVVTVAVLLLLVLGCLFFAKRCWSDGKAKKCLELCMEERNPPPKENNPLVPNPHGTAESSIPECQMSWDEPRTPEEVDDLSQEITITTEVHLTENGKFVMQDKGKTEMTLEQEV